MKKVLILLVLNLVLCLQTNSQIIRTVAGDGISGYSGDGGMAISAHLSKPAGIAFDRKGNLLIGDVDNNCIRRVDASGIITTIAGTGIMGYTGDGGPATAAQIAGPYTVVVDSVGNIFFADGTSGTIRKIDTFGKIYTAVGNGAGIYSGDSGPATSAGLDNPTGVALDKQGNMYVADAFTYRVRKVNIAGIINTIAGNGVPGFVCTAGLATAVALNMPSRVIPDEHGSVYFTDFSNCIHKIDYLGNLTTIAGSDIAGYSGDGGAAIVAGLNAPIGITVSSSSAIFFADAGNHRVRKIDASGIITTIAGNGVAGFSGDGGQATAAKIYDPNGIAIDRNGNVFFTEYGGNRVREIIYNLTVPFANSSKGDIRSYPNPAIDVLNFEFPLSATATIKITDITGRVLEQQILHNDVGITIKVAGYVPGIYLYQVTTDNATTSGKVLIR